MRSGLELTHCSLQLALLSQLNSEVNLRLGNKRRSQSHHLTKQLDCAAAVTQLPASGAESVLGLDESRVHTEGCLILLDSIQGASHAVIGQSEMEVG